MSEEGRYTLHEVDTVFGGVDAAVECVYGGKEAVRRAKIRASAWCEDEKPKMQKFSGYVILIGESDFGILVRPYVEGGGNPPHPIPEA